MIKAQTINNFNKILSLIEKSGLTINAYFKSIDKNPSNFYTKARKLLNAYNNKEFDAALTGVVKNTLDTYNNILNRTVVLNNIEETLESEPYIPGLEEELLDTDDKAEALIVRDSNGKITGYKFKVYRRDKSPVTGTLSREEMQTIYRLYSYYGASITQREVSRHFPDYSLQDFKRILRVFNITKASGPFAPHWYEEKTEDELKEYHLREKENDFLKKIEKDELNDIRKTAVKLARENRELQDKLESLDTIKVDLKDFNPSTPCPSINNDRTIVLFLSDMHIGARCNSYTLYPNEWNKDELMRRLTSILERLDNFGTFDKIILCMLGDNLDGMDGQTARRDHIMPQNMDNMEQIETFIEVMVPFIDSLFVRCQQLEIYSTKCGNHDGITGYTASLALKNVIMRYYPTVPFILFKEFIGKFNVNSHTYCLCHGK